jgi:hypothetical protein
MHVLNELRKSLLDVSHGIILQAIDLLGLECFDKALGRSVVVGIPFAGHTDPELIRSQDIDVLKGCILYPSVRVMDDSRWRISRLESHLKGSEA